MMKSFSTARLVLAALLLQSACHSLEEEEPNAQFQPRELDWCWHECVEYGDVVCGGSPAAHESPYLGRRRSLRQFKDMKFDRPLPGNSISAARAARSFSAELEVKPIDQWTFEEKCLAVTECRQVEGSAVPCGWCQTGLEFMEGFSATCRKDGRGSCYPRELCHGTWTWQFFRCPTENDFGCYQPCKHRIKKCVDPDFDMRNDEDEAEIVAEDFQYFVNPLGRR